MTTSLYWKVTRNQDNDPTLSTSFKRAIARRFWQHDGSLPGGEFIVGKDFLRYLNGLMDATVASDGPQDLIASASELSDLIDEHGEISLWIE